jgi:hypothetical protein
VVLALSDQGMTPLPGGSIKALVGPTELDAPDDHEAVIVECIDDAQKFLDIAVQEVDSAS